MHAQSLLSRRTVLIFGLAVFTAVLIALSTRGASAGGATVISTGDKHTCAVTTTGAAKCWGSNEYGQIGVGVIGGPEICGGQGSIEVPCSTTPRTVSGLGSGVQSISAASRFTCALTTGGEVYCFGASGSGQLGVDPAGPETCPATFDTACSTIPLHIDGIAGATDISVGSSLACVITGAGGVMCWGGNFYGQLGNGSITGPDTCGTLACSLTPVQVTGLTSGVEKISAGGSHTCALLSTGSLECWGVSWKGQLGNGTHEGPEDCFSSRDCSSTPVSVLGLANDVQDVSAGSAHTCALMESLGVKCWGHNLWGQLGAGVTDGPGNCLGFLDDPCIDIPVDVVDLAGVIYLNESAGNTACAALSGGGVKCWGANNLNQMGIGDTGPETCNVGFKCSTTPMDVLDLSDVTAVASGGSHTCAITILGGVKCWGYKFYGATGDNTWSPTTAFASAPVDVIGLAGAPPIPPADRVWGDLNCSGALGPDDALGGLLFGAGLPVPPVPDCFLFGQQLQVDGSAVAFGDVDCSGTIDLFDPLGILRKDAGLPDLNGVDCPDVGDSVFF